MTQGFPAYVRTKRFGYRRILYSTVGNPARTAATIAASAAALLIARKLLTRPPRERLSLSGKIVLITGGSRGLGLALAKELGARGSRLALCARHEQELEEACKRLADDGIDAAGFTCDISNASEIQPLISRVLDRFGKIDVLVNNAGHIKVAPLESLECSDFEDAMNVMFWGPVNLTLALLPHLRRQGAGHVVNITSVGGRVAVPHLLPYSCAKFALVGFSTALSTELTSQGLHVLTVIPGLMRTGSYLNAEFKGKEKNEFAWFSLLGNFPGFSVSAEHAARSIREALEEQRHTCTISLAAKLLISSEALLPELTRSVLASSNRWVLPASASSKTSAKGKVLNPRFNKLFQAVTALGRSAAANLNE